MSVCVCVHICVSICMRINVYIYIYIYMYACMYVHICIDIYICMNIYYICVNRYVYICINMCICIFRQHFFINANFIKHNRHFMSTYFLLDPFEFPYYFYRIRGELIYVLSIVVCMAESTRDTYNYGQYINQFLQFLVLLGNIVRAE